MTPEERALLLTVARILLTRLRNDGSDLLDDLREALRPFEQVNVEDESLRRMFKL